MLMQAIIYVKDMKIKQYYAIHSSIKMKII